MVKEVISRCDVCGTSEEVEEVEIKLQGVTKSVDLCGEHRAPVVEVFDLGTEVTSKGRARKGGRSSHAVVPIEEWNPEEQ